MSKLAHSNQETMDAIERSARTSEERGERDEPEHTIAFPREGQRLVARIKRSSKYYGQTEPGAWFDVSIVDDRHYQLRGNNNNYQIGDVVFGVRMQSGAIVELR